MNDRSRAPSPLWIGLGAAALTALALGLRFVFLDSRPVIHDESLFGYYAYVFANRGDYTHMPILHGPTLILTTGWIFREFGASIEAARAYLGFCSLVAIAAALPLVPRRLRAATAALLLTSPILLYFSRFLRNDLLFCAVLMLAMLGVVRVLSPGRGRGAWAALGVAASLALLGIKENALFPYAAALTFAVVWVLLRRRGDAAEDPCAERPRIPALGVVVGALLGLALLGSLYGKTLPPEQHLEVRRAVAGADAALDTPLSSAQQLGVWARLSARSWQNLRDSWSYWEGQHSEHRIEGPVHYHLPILATYELPILLLIAAGLALDATLRRRRAAAYLGGFVTWLAIWGAWRWIALPEPPGWLGAIQDFLHLDPDASILVLGIIIAPLLVWSICALRDGRTLAAWTGWWAACSLFQYSVAGEKVPWLALHIALPLYLVAAWIWEPRAAAWGTRGRRIATAVVIASCAIALRHDVGLIGERAADPRERMVYNHTTPWIHAVARNRLARWQEPGVETPLSERRVVLVGAPVWPGVWYFRDTKYVLLGEDATDAAAVAEALEPGADLVLAPIEWSEHLARRPDANAWHVLDGSLRNNWRAPWPDEAAWSARFSKDGDERPALGPLLRSTLGKLWRYFWYREAWTETGVYPLVAIEPRAPRP